MIGLSNFVIFHLLLQSLPNARLSLRTPLANDRNKVKLVERPYFLSLANGVPSRKT